MEKGAQRKKSANLCQVVEDALKNGVFSACSVGIVHMQKEEPLREIHFFGNTDRDGKGRLLDKDTRYDLASLTKPLVTALSLMALTDARQLDLNDRLERYFPIANSVMREITISMLLSHSSGLPAHRSYFRMFVNDEHERRQKRVVQAILSEQLAYLPGKGAIYSDLGYILLGCVIEKITGQSLDRFWKSAIIEPLGLKEELYFPREEAVEDTLSAVTGTCGWTGRKLCGIVHDDNCRMMGGVAGHAGLFGTITGVLSLAENLLLQYRGIRPHPAYSRSTIKDFLTRRPHSSWTYGFDTPSAQSSSSGRYFSRKAVGHLGFTGTSFWIDLEKSIIIVLLTNRVLMGNDQSLIKNFRPLLHDIIMQDLLRNKKTRLTE